MKNRMLQMTAMALLLSAPAVALADRDDADTALTRASSGVAAAERAGAREAATVELGLAHDQLMLARRACERRDWEICERAAHRALADARLAEARTRQQQAEAATAAIEAAIDDLRAELARQGA